MSFIPIAIQISTWRVRNLESLSTWLYTVSDAPTAERVDNAALNAAEAQNMSACLKANRKDASPPIDQPLSDLPSRKQIVR